jgi:hypothetical protein
MRNSVQSLLFALAVIALGLGYLYWVTTNFDVGMRLGQKSPTVTVPGFIAVALGLWLTLRTFLLVRIRDALLRGEGALAYWRISPSEWDAWRVHDAARSASWPTLRNKLRPAGGPAPMEGMPIVIGPRTIVMGRSIVPLNVTGFSPFAIWGLCDVSLADGPSPSLEFTRYIVSQHAITHNVDLVRIPVGGAGRSQAQRVLDHFAAAIPDIHRARERGMFPDHFMAMTGDSGAAARVRRSARDHSFPALFLGLGGLAFWYNRTGGIQPMGSDFATLVLVASVAALAASAYFWLGGYLGRRR